MKINGSENNTFILAEIGKRIKEIRVTHSMTQKEMAEKAGVSTKTVERIESGENVKIENLLNVLRILNFLQNINLLVPEQEFLSVEEKEKKRQRVSKKKIVDNDVNEWKWGAEI